jgi:prepilin-type N-terminal cleavage/methylation domain-containing protein
MYRNLGFTIVELLVTVVVIAVGIALVMAAGAQFRTDNAVSQTATQVIRLDRAIREAYRADASYTGISIAELDARQAIPVEMRVLREGASAIEIRTALGTNIGIGTSSHIGDNSTATGSPSYLINLAHLKRQECVALFQRLAPAFLRTEGVSGTVVVTRNRGETPATADVQAACPADLNNSIRLINN